MNKIMYTKNGKTMARITLEDPLGEVEVIIWPDDYEKNSAYLNEEAKVFIEGRVSAEDEKDAKVICNRIIPFDSVARRVWIKFSTKDEYIKKEHELNKIIADSDGKDIIVIYAEDTKEKKTLPQSSSVRADDELIARLSAAFGSDNVKLT